MHNAAKYQLLGVKRAAANLCGAHESQLATSECVCICIQSQESYDE